ncbi:MAG TPA: DUF1080 domain-containing protein [Flavitalea sp.]|nr:DUF1080 domain-containing protein [Flavitalea sp.]
MSISKIFPFLLLSGCLLSQVAFTPQESVNILTGAEKKSGWKLLFDGKTLKGWHPYNNAKSDGWTIANGELVNKTQGVSNRADLVTNDVYENFDLQLDWKVNNGANSGLLYRVKEGKWPAYESGPEYQFIDDNGYADKLEDWQKSGADYAMHPPTQLVANAVGTYNHTRIIAKKGHIEHWLNGVKVASFDMWTPEWKELKSKGKWKDVKEYGIQKIGHIALQDHGGGITFRNIKIRKL